MLFDVTISIIMLAVLALLILYIRPKLKKAEQEEATPGRTKVLQIIVGIVTAIATWFVAVIMSFAHIMQTVADTYMSGREPLISPLMALPYLAVIILLSMTRSWRILIAFLVASFILVFLFEAMFILPYARILTTDK